LEFKPLVGLGIVSYAFYLWHLPVFFAIRYFDPHWNDVVRVIVACVVTLSLTLLSWFLLERPLMRWAKRLEGKRYAKAVVTADVLPTNGSASTSGEADREAPEQRAVAEPSGSVDGPSP
jgi:peptidoglycan/LPS O-acetylase OafA/YrhL